MNKMEYENRNRCKWISCRDKNPTYTDEITQYLVTLEDPSGERYVEILDWDGSMWDEVYTDDNKRQVWGVDKVIAWMPVPDIYKGE